MPVRLVVDNTELKKQVLSGEKHMGNFTQVEFEAFNQLVASMSLNEIDAFTTAAAAPVCEVFGYDELNPSWFVHGTKFEHDVWQIKVGQNALTIDFHVPLNDGNLLVSIRHRPLLNTLKHWLVQAGNPYVNGGKLLKAETTYIQLKNRLLLIDGILARADELNLAQRHMLVVNSDFIQELMAEYVEGTGHKLRRYHEKVRGYLLKKIETVSDEAAAAFAEQYPHITRNIDVEENELLLTKDQRIRACCFLYSNWAYGNKPRNRKYMYSTPNSNYFRDILFKHKTLNVNDWRLSRLRSLAITPEEDSAEFFRVPISDYVKDGVGLNALSQMLTAFRGLASIDTADASLCPDGAFDDITVKSINEQVIVRNVGRYTTLPTDIVFTAIRNAFEFCYQYADVILDSMHQFLKHVPKNNKKLKDSNRRSPLSIYKSGGFLEYVSPELVELGVCQWCIDNRDPDRFELRRQNWGLLDLFNVLSGCIQVIIGATMARRVSELIELPPKECLLPSGVNPNLESSKDVEFELIFDNRKSGVGGEEELRETVSRPILRSVAVFIYKLEEFNKKLFADKLITTKKKDFVYSN
ncbi:hypothetical protein [Vibrio sp. YYF0003]|uniref:hypothetical protein n=1 Tax=Vibrio sp. YYF0003 TaxID=3116646 RepID=UPI002EB537D8|nr:hypothetical protein [Vibrio sp. YYF0003]